MKYCSINGIEQKNINIADRGFSYGDGIFTTAKLINGQIVLLEKHIERLRQGCQVLKIAAPSVQSLTRQLQLVAKSYSQAVLKVIITAGSGGRGYSRVGLSEDDRNIIIIISDYPKHYKELARQGLDLGDAKLQIGVSPMLGGLKHLNRLEQVLLRGELDERKEDDLVVTNCLGHVVEATCANLFYWKKGQLCTPELSMSGVNGIIRQTILVNSPEVQVCQSNLADLRDANSMFICNSLMGIMPVKTYNNRKLDIDDVLQLQSKMKGLI